MLSIKVHKIIYNLIPFCSKISHIHVYLLVDSDSVFQGCPKHGLEKICPALTSLSRYKFHRKQDQVKTLGENKCMKYRIKSRMEIMPGDYPSTK